MSDALLPLVVIIPLFGGGVALLGKTVKGRTAEHIASMAAVITVAGSGVVLGLLAPAVFRGETIRYSLGGWPEPYGISMVLDGFAWLSSALVVAVSIPVCVAALSRRLYGASFFFFLLLLIAGMLSVSLTGDLFTMFVSFEIVAISAYVLIAFEKSDAGLVASFKYLILSSVGILFFLFGIFLVYRDLGILTIYGISSALSSTPSAGETPAIHLAVAALCVGIGVRTAFIPFHTWLPEAHAYAPHPVSALLSGVLIKVSLLALFRILFLFSGAYLNNLLLWIGGATALMAVVVALAQSDAKRLLAFHSVSQMGYVLAAFAASREISLAASLSHAVNHAFFKSLLFLSVGTAIDLSGERDLYAMRPVGRRAPLLAVLYLVGALSISGLPPFNGFASKGFVMHSTAGSPVAVLLWITGAATVASFIKLSRIFLPTRKPAPSGAGADDTTLRPGILTIIAMTFLALSCVVTGIFAVPIGRMLHALTASGPPPYIPALYSANKLLSTAMTAATGIGFYFLVISAPGKRAAAKIRTYAPDLRTVLLLFLLGLVGFSAVAYL